MTKNCTGTLVISSTFFIIFLANLVVFMLIYPEIFIFANNEINNPYNIKAMSFNICYEDDFDTGFKNWIFRRFQVLSLLRREMPDIIGLQEARLHQYETLREYLPEYDSVYTARDGKEDEGVPIFYKKSIWSKTDNGTFWLSKTPYVVGSVIAGLPRIATWVLLRSIQDGLTLIVVNTHYEITDMEAKSISTDLIIELLRNVTTIYDEPLKIVMGDFNANSSDLYNFTTKGNLKEAYIEDPDYYDTTVSGWTGGNVESRIDHIFVSNNLDCVQFGIIRRYNLINGQKSFASDHYPIMAALNIN